MIPHAQAGILFKTAIPWPELTPRNTSWYILNICHLLANCILNFGCSDRHWEGLNFTLTFREYIKFHKSELKSIVWSWQAPRWASESFTKTKSHVLHLGWGSPQHQHRLGDHHGTNWLRAKNILEVLQVECGFQKPDLVKDVPACVRWSDFDYP